MDTGALGLLDIAFVKLNHHHKSIRESHELMIRSVMRHDMRKTRRSNSLIKSNVEKYSSFDEMSVVDVPRRPCWIHYKYLLASARKIPLVACLRIDLESILQHSTMVMWQGAIFSVPN